MKRIHFDYIKQATEIPGMFIIGLFRKKDVKNPKKILIINTALIGDILSSFPAIRQFIRNNKSAEVDLLVTSLLKPLAEKIRGVGKVYAAKSISERSSEQASSKRDREEFLKNDYDLILALRLSRDAYHVVRKLKINAIKTTFISYLKYLNYISKKNTTDSAKQVKQFFFEAMNLRSKKLSFDEIFDFSKKDYKKIKALKEMKLNGRKILIHTGSGWELKHWENKKWIELLKRINKLGNFKFIFVGGDKLEEESFGEIQKHLDFKIYSLIRKIDLKDLMLVMRLSDYFIGIDSGPRNMSYLADLRSIGLVGPGPRIYMPYDKRDIIINKARCKCNASFCFKKETCMQKITVDDVFEGFKKILRLKKS